VAMKRLNNPHVKAFPYSLNRPKHTTPHTACTHWLSVNNRFHRCRAAKVRECGSFLQRIAHSTLRSAQQNAPQSPATSRSRTFATGRLASSARPMASTREPKGFGPKRRRPRQERRRGDASSRSAPWSQARRIDVLRLMRRDFCPKYA